MESHSLTPTCFGGAALHITMTHSPLARTSHEITKLQESGEFLFPCTQEEKKNQTQVGVTHLHHSEKVHKKFPLNSLVVRQVLI